MERCRATRGLTDAVADVRKDGEPVGASEFVYFGGTFSQSDADSTALSWADSLLVAGSHVYLEANIHIIHNTLVL